MLEFITIYFDFQIKFMMHQVVIHGRNGLVDEVHKKTQLM